MRVQILGTTDDCDEYYNIEHEFCSFELAKKLAEKGYPQNKKNTLAMYNEEGEWFSLASNLDDYEYAFEDFDDRDCVCPTISQVLKWLREEKEIDIILYPIVLYNENNRVREYSIEIYALQLNKPVHLDYFKEWEKGANAGIEYVLDNLI